MPALGFWYMYQLAQAKKALATAPPCLNRFAPSTLLPEQTIQETKIPKCSQDHHRECLKISKARRQRRRPLPCSQPRNPTAATGKGQGVGTHEHREGLKSPLSAVQLNYLKASRFLFSGNFNRLIESTTRVFWMLLAHRQHLSKELGDTVLETNVFTSSQ